MYGLYLLSQRASPRQVAKLDNQAVTKVAATEPTREESDVDFRVPLANTMRQIKLQAEWIKRHRKEKEAKDNEDKKDIQYNNITDGLDKQAAKLAPQHIAFTSPASVHIAGGEAPTPATPYQPHPQSAGTCAVPLTHPSPGPCLTTTPLPRAVPTSAA